MTHTYVILDGLQDPAYAQAISRAWTATGFVNGIDVAGQAGWLEKLSSVQGPGSGVGEDAKPQAAMTEADVDRAAGAARGFGVELRDRVGATFRPDNDLAALRAHMAYEYKSRLATAVVFGLPAVVLHYVARYLAGGGHDPHSMIYPWFFELVLVGWACLAGGWPILWQGALSLAHLRVTGDLLTSLIVLGAYVPSAVGVLALMVVRQPWLAAQPGHEPLFFVAMFAMVLALLQRWLAYRAINGLSGRAMLMVPRLSRWLSLWMLLSVVLAIAGGPRWGLTMALLMPPMVGLGAINRWSSGPSMVLPVFGFAMFLLLGPGLLHRELGPEKLEIAAGFQGVMAGMMGGGWVRNPKSEARNPNQIPMTK